MGQVVVMKMPDILLLAKESNSELSYSAMNDILLLILGCAIQCEKKEEFIEHIKQLDVDVQRGLVLSIQEITENPDNVIPYRINDLAEVPRDELLILCENLYRHLQGAMEQRDDYIETIIDFVLLQDSEEGAREEREGNKEVEESPKFRPRNSITQASFHSNNLLQAKKEKISNLQAELDEQNAMMVDMKEECEQVKVQLESMRLENKHLVSEAAWAKTYRDEIDVLKSQLESANKLRAENGRLKAIAEDVDFYKKKYEELQDQTEQLYEEKEVLVEQAKDSANKLQRLVLMENENKKLCTQVNLLVEEQGEDQRRIRELVDEIAKLSIEKQESISQCSLMNAELAGLKMQKEDDGLNVPLMVEYNQSADLLRLEKDNKHLQSLVSNMGVSDNRIKSLEEYNRNLAENVVYYKNLIGKLIKCLILAGHTNQDISDKAKEEHRKNMSLLATLKQPTQLEQQDITTSLDELAQHLAKKGVFVDISTLKDTIVNGVDAKVGETSEERKDEDEETNVLRGTLDERESRILQLERSVAEMGTQGEEVSKLKKEIAIKDESITQLKDNLDRSNELVSRMSSQLKNDVSEKEQKVIKLKQSEQKLKDVEVRNTDLENDIASKDQTIAHLKRSMDSMQGLSVLNNDLKDTLSMKEHQISELEKTVEELDIKENGKKCEENEAKNQLIMEENKLKEREVKLKEKEMKVKEKEAKVKEKESKDKDSKIKLEGKEKLVKGREIEIKEKESEIKEKEREVNEKEAELKNLGTELEEKEKLVEEKETELNEKGKIAQEKEAELDEKEKKVGKKENDINEQERKVDRREIEVYEKEKILVKKETEIVEKEQQVDKMKSVLLEKEKEVSKKEDQIKVRQLEVDEKEKLVTLKENQICEKERTTGLSGSETEQRLKKVELREVEVQEKETKVEKMLMNVDQKTSEIEGREKKVATKEAEVEDLVKNVEDKEKIIQTKVEAIAEREKEKLVTLKENQICEKERTTGLSGSETEQ